MSNERPVWYEPHPVSAERKAELRAKGYQIIDAIFAPLSVKELEQTPIQEVAPLVRRRRPPKTVLVGNSNDD